MYAIRTVLRPCWPFPSDGGAIIDHGTASLSVPAFIADAHEIATAHGFWDDRATWEHDPNLRRQVLAGKLMLIVSEIGEAETALRDGDMPNFAEELADIEIRAADLAGYLGLAIRADALESATTIPAPPGTARALTPDHLLGIYGSLANACEALRHDDLDGFTASLTEAMAITALLAGIMGINLDHEIATKMEVNRGREYRHGKRF